MAHEGPARIHAHNATSVTRDTDEVWYDTSTRRQVMNNTHVRTRSAREGRDGRELKEESWKSLLLAALYVCVYMKTLDIS